MRSTLLSLAWLLIAGSAGAAEPVSLSGTLQPLACASGCGVCCATHLIKEGSSSLSILVGNSFTPLEKFGDGLSIHRFTGRFYTAAGQCDVGQCTFFQIESVDQAQVAEPVYDPNTQQLEIPSAAIVDSDQHYQLVLTPPFTTGSLVELTEPNRIGQGDDCLDAEGQCAEGSTCLAYYGIAGAGGPRFKSCEIPCSLPGASCPSGQACINIADGPGQVCRTQ